MAALPKITIKYGKSLDNITRVYGAHHPTSERMRARIPHTPEEMKRIVSGYKKAWNPLENEILTKMMKCLGLQFRRNIIEAYVVNGVSSSFAHPLVVSACYSADRFVEVFTHEIIHILIEENNDINSWESANYLRLLAPEESDTSVYSIGKVHSHIEVFAVMKLVLPDKYLRKDYRQRQYQKAWDIVEREGAKDIIEGVRAYYRKRKQESSV